MRRPTASLGCSAKGEKYKESLNQRFILSYDIAKCIFQCVDYYNLVSIIKPNMTAKCNERYLPTTLLGHNTKNN